MLPPVFINRLIILGFMAIIGFSIAKSIQAGSPLGLILAIVGLVAGIYLVYLLKDLHAEAKEGERS